MDKRGKRMIIREDTWDLFQDYLKNSIEYFESINDMDFEECTLRDQLRSILWYNPEEDIEE